MSSHRFQHAIDVGRKAQIAASKVPNSLFPVWRQRAFRRQLGRFIVSLQAVPQHEAAKLSAESVAELNAVVEGVVAGAEVFMAERHDSTTSEIEQDRFVVTEIYQLRAAVESLARHVTADPNAMDVRWTMGTETRNQPKP